jgi:flagellar biosynthesis protein FlhF
MIIKSFVAESASAALKQIRSELGGDAVVLKTRRVRNRLGGYDVEVTACHDRPSAAQASTVIAKKEQPNGRRVTAPVWTRAESTSRRPVVAVAAADEPSLTTINAKLDRLLMQSNPLTENDSEVAGFLRDADLPSELTRQLSAECADFSQLEQKLAIEIRNRIETKLTFTTGDRVAVIGPAGAGKTTVVGKLAAQLVSERKKITLCGVHQSKVGAIDELQSLSDLIGVTAHMGSDHSSERSGITLIDAGDAAISAADLSALNPTHTVLVLSALMRTSDLAAVAARAATLGITHLVLTMLDQTYRIGGIFAACDITGARLAYVNDSPSGVGLLHHPDPSGLTAHLMSSGGADVVR